MATAPPFRDITDACILLVEDEYVLAYHLADTLEAAGACVLGPHATVADALAGLEAATRVDAAVLDVNLGGEAVFPVADALHARGVPFVFVSGYDRTALPPRYADVPNCIKPVTLAAVVDALGLRLSKAP